MTWSCVRCTFINEANTDICAVCEHKIYLTRKKPVKKATQKTLPGLLLVQNNHDKIEDNISNDSNKNKKNKKNKIYWTCLLCTFNENEDINEYCSICESAKGLQPRKRSTCGSDIICF